jgi:hypothetical protein
MSSRQASSTCKVFISHSHQNRHTAVDLQTVLEEQGAETFLDQDRIEAVDNLPAQVQKGISWCDSLLLLWSASAASSSWVRREWDMAYELRKKIIPYVLDRTPLPSALENLVYIAASDQQHGNAQLLRAVLGRDFQPSPETLFPGLWQASVDAFGMIQGTYDLELRANGQVEGEGGVSDTGLLGQIAGQTAMSGVLSMRIPIHGSWSYDRGTQILTIQTSTGVVFGQQQNDTITIRATGREKGAMSGQDLAGRKWTLRRVGETARSRAEDAKRQEVRKALREILEKAKGSGVAALVLHGYCLGVQMKCEFDLGLPTLNLTGTKGDDAAYQAACKDFMRACERWSREAGSSDGSA